MKLSANRFLEDTEGELELDWDTGLLAKTKCNFALTQELKASHSPPRGTRVPVRVHAPLPPSVKPKSLHSGWGGIILFDL